MPHSSHIRSIYPLYHTLVGLQSARIPNLRMISRYNKLESELTAIGQQIIKRAVAEALSEQPGTGYIHVMDPNSTLDSNNSTDATVETVESLIYEEDRFTQYQQNSFWIFHIGPEIVLTLLACTLFVSHFRRSSARIKFSLNNEFFQTIMPKRPNIKFNSIYILYFERQIKMNLRLWC